MKSSISTKSTAMSIDQVKAATSDLKALQQKMTFVLPLTVAERRDHATVRIGPKKLRIVGNRLAAAQQHQELLPPAFDLRKFEVDTQLAGALDECVTAINEMHAAVYDTLLAVGHRAVISAATAYAHIQVSSTTAERLKRTVEKMTQRKSESSGTATAPVVVPAPVGQTVVAGAAEPLVKAAEKAA